MRDELKSKQEYTAYFDHTLLRADAKKTEIEMLCEEAKTYGFFGVCVNSQNLKIAVARLAGSKSIPLTVVGFPLGAMSTEAKVFETKWSVDAGAKEIDTVLNIGAYLSGEEAFVRQDLVAVIKAAGSAAPVKVIIETAYLKPTQITEVSSWCVDAGAAFVKTSTGFASRGASVADIETIRSALEVKNALGHVGIKASGGIKTADVFLDMVKAGATRVGSSQSVSILKELTRLGKV